MNNENEQLHISQIDGSDENNDIYDCPTIVD